MDRVQVTVAEADVILEIVTLVGALGLIVSRGVAPVVAETTVESQVLPAASLALTMK